MNTFSKTQEGNILIVDDDAGILVSAQLFLNQYYKKVYVELNPKNIQAILSKKKIEVVLLDMNFQKGKNDGKDGFKYLQLVLTCNPKAQVIFMTAYGDIDMAIQALKAGAVDFVTKPWKNDKLLTTVETAIKLAAKTKEIDVLKSANNSLQVANNKELSGFIGPSQIFQQTKATLNKVAPTNASVLLLGENGTGKGMAANYIHQYSDRSNSPFITVDVGSISASLFESELFGHEKGAFTDAHQQKIGRLEIANNGTLFLDEIGNLSLSAQAKLLSVLQNRQVVRLGSNETIPLDIRLICATNMPLTQLVNEGKFREDLLYRINTVEIRMPNLSERIDDLENLLQFFLEKLKLRYGKPQLSIAQVEIEKLKRLSWPGNIRELEHSVERAVIMAETPLLQVSDFRNTMQDTLNFDQNSLILKDMEVIFIKKSMALHNNNITHAAKELGIDRLALHRRLEKYGLQ
jgi:DNA-binding NtrC family response regulator